MPKKNGMQHYYVYLTRQKIQNLLIQIIKNISAQRSLKIY